MVGDRAFEYYNEKNVEDYIQIPWDQIDHVAASVKFGGRLIPRFAICTTDFKNGMGLKINDKYYTIVEFQHVKPGKGAVLVGSKPGTIETGAVIQVPMYLNQGERIKVDTRTGKFVSRV